MITPDQSAQYRGHETEQAERSYHDRMAKATHGIVVDPVHAAKVSAWIASKNKDIEFEEGELEVVDLSFLLSQKVA